MFLYGLPIALREIEGIRGRVVSLIKARHAVAVRVTAGVDHTMQGGFIHASRPFAQKIADIDHEDILYCWDVEPFVLMMNLETVLAWLLKENGQSAKVRVSTCSGLASVVREVWRVMEQLQVASWLSYERAKVLSRNSEAKDDDLQELACKLKHALVICLYWLAKDLDRKFWPLVGSLRDHQYLDSPGCRGALPV